MFLIIGPLEHGGRQTQQKAPCRLQKGLFGQWSYLDSGIICLICPWKCLRVLCTLCDSSHVPADLSCVCMHVYACVHVVPDAVLSWLQGYDNTESSVRKASVFCLVAIYSVIGEELKPHLAQLTGSKVLSSAASLSMSTHTRTLGNLLNRCRALSSSHVGIFEPDPTSCPIIKQGGVAPLSLHHVSLSYVRPEGQVHPTGGTLP